MFKVGDRIVLINAKARSAQVGATATVTKLGSDILYGPSVHVIWDRTNPLCMNQSDGGYMENIFMLENSDTMPDPEFSLDEIHEAQSLIS